MTAPSAFQLHQFAGILRSGGVIAYPTEGVFGLGCDPRNRSALERILRIKGRQANKGLILIGSTEAQLWEFATALDATRMARVRASWPGPVTWIFPARDEVSALITGGRGTVAVRATAHRGAAALCDAFGGALVSTSANLAGRQAARTRLQVMCCLGTVLDGILPGRVGHRQGPSAIRDARTAHSIRGRADDA